MTDEERERSDMRIDTESFNRRNGEIIPTDDIDKDVVDQYYLAEDKAEIKRMCWEQNNAEYLKDQKKKKEQKEQEARFKQKYNDQQSHLYSISESGQSGLIAGIGGNKKLYSD